MESDALVGVVLVNYNGRRFLNNCIRALLAGSYRNIEPVVVDNHSTDDSIPALRDEFPSVVVLQQSENLGVAAGNNVGIRFCLERGHDFVLLLNFDTLPDTDLVAELVRVASSGTIVSGSTYFWDECTRSNSHAGSFNWFLGRLREKFFGRVDSEVGQEIRQVEIADTCCLLVPRSAFANVGLMDEAYFLYYDDTDFVVRARAAGYTCLFNPAAKLRHYERGASGPVHLSPISVYYTTRNRPYFMKHHAPSRVHYLLFLCYFSLTRLISVLRWIVLGRWPLVYWTMRGLDDFVRGRMGRRDVLARPSPASA
jgi:GT2 family glycosyltransferase